jgi:hypothetical protein
MFSIHGIGTAVYGERDYRPDGSYVTTEFAIFAWMPIFPIASLRISCFQTRPYAAYGASSYYVHETTSPNLTQVLSVYSWFASFIALCFAAGRFQEDLAIVVCILALGTLVALPSALRRRAKRRNAREWERAKARAGPPAT